jgi:hypothetical protein
MRLDRLLQSNGCIIYHENLPDCEYPTVLCSIYGATKSNELFVRLTNGTLSFVEAIPSDLLFPPMADRIFGMDVADQHVAFSLATCMWEKHREALVPNAQK